MKNVFSVLSASLLLAACSNVDFKKTKAGVPYKIIGNSKGDSIRQGNIVKFEVIQKTKDTVLMSSYIQKEPQYIQVQPVPPLSNYNDLGGNIMEILTKAKKGDSIYITQVTDSLLKAFPDMAASLKVQKGDQYITTLKIVEVYKTPEEANAAAIKDRLANYDNSEKTNFERFNKDTMVQSQMAIDKKIIEEYLAKNNIQTQKTYWGVYVQMLNPGQGPKPAPGQFASVKYSGSNLAGQVFDSGTIPVQVGLSGSIKGFDEGVKQLSKGGKAKIFIPSILAYGPRGNAPKIAPNENLIFDLELLDITNTQPSQAAPMMRDTIKE